jgi:hypothetical protein
MLAYVDNKLSVVEGLYRIGLRIAEKLHLKNTLFRLGSG